MLFAIVENVLSDEISEAAEEAVDGLIEAADDTGGATPALVAASMATVVRGVAMLALGAVVAPPAARSGAEGH